MVPQHAHSAEDQGPSASEKSQAGRYMAHLSWANTEDRSARTAPARAARDRRFLELAGGDPVRAASLRKAFFVEMALRSAKARRRNREAREAGAA